jgi:tRNA threonylcarbamoyladenosine biosynthesis protein TsaE
VSVIDRAETRETHSAEGTERLGEALARALAVGDIVGLRGPLGSGKTRLAAGLARGLGVTSRVRSPSFTLVNEYAGRLRLLHLDLYRLEERGVDGLGIDELLARGVVVVEWAERLPHAWLAEALEIVIEPDAGTRRRLSARAGAGRGLELLAAWRALPGAPDEDAR